MRRNILLITHAIAEKAGTTRAHVRALERRLNANVLKVDCAIADHVNFSNIDVVILHYSLVISSRRYVSEQLANKIARFKGLRILFIQDEYRWVDRTAIAMRELAIDVVFSLVAPATIRKVYHHPWCDRIRFEHTLAGFVPEELVRLRVPAIDRRPIDVGYRARKLLPWYGEHALQKWQIAERFAADAELFGLNVDIATSEESRLYGKKWIAFLLDCRAMLGTESGASICDFTDEIRAKVESHVARDPGTTYAELRERYFKDADGKIVMNVISPRCFEAAAARTLMIMYPGEYNGLLEGGRHYVVLDPDHRNIEDVVDTLRSSKRAGEIIHFAYTEIAASGRWSYAALAEHVDRVIREEAGPSFGRQGMAIEHCISYARWRAATAPTKACNVILRVGAAIFRSLMKFVDKTLPTGLRPFVKPVVENLHCLCRNAARRLFANS